MSAPIDTDDQTTRVWLITGAGRGLGRAFAEAALDAGDQVVGTVRTPGVLAALESEHPDALRVLELDVRDREAVRQQVDAAAAAFGRLDVVVNNAGYGLVGAIEEVGETEVRDHLDTNLLGALWVSQAAIPHLRAAGGGDLVQISTTGAIGSMPTLGLYNAGKWGLEGFSEALAAEMAPFGIHVTIAELGGFATDWAGTSMQFAVPKDGYDDLRTNLFGTSEVPWPTGEDAGGAGSDDDGGDDAEEGAGDAPPATAAAALLAHLASEERPLRVLIGDDAPEQAAMAFAARRDSYGGDARLAWPPPETS